jgi:hypothetical protein
MKDFMINVSDVVLRTPQPHVLRAEHKRSDVDFDLINEAIANRIREAKSTEEILTYAFDMVKNKQKRARNDERNYHIDRSEMLIGRMKNFLMQNLRSDAIITRKSLREAFCDEFVGGTFANEDFAEIMGSILYGKGDIKAVTVIDEALRDLEKEGKIKKVKFINYRNSGYKIKRGYMLVENKI